MEDPAGADLKNFALRICDRPSHRLGHELHGHVSAAATRKHRARQDHECNCAVCVMSVPVTLPLTLLHSGASEMPLPRAEAIADRIGQLPHPAPLPIGRDRGGLTASERRISSDNRPRIGDDLWASIEASDWAHMLHLPASILARERGNVVCRGCFAHSQLTNTQPNELVRFSACYTATPRSEYEQAAYTEAHLRNMRRHARLCRYLRQHGAITSAVAARARTPPVTAFFSSSSPGTAVATGDTDSGPGERIASESSCAERVASLDVATTTNGASASAVGRATRRQPSRGARATFARSPGRSCTCPLIRYLCHLSHCIADSSTFSDSDSDAVISDSTAESTGPAAEESLDGILRSPPSRRAADNRDALRRPHSLQIASNEPTSEEPFTQRTPRHCHVQPFHQTMSQAKV